MAQIRGKTGACHHTHDTSQSNTATLNALVFTASMNGKEVVLCNVDEIRYTACCDT